MSEHLPPPERTELYIPGPVDVRDEVSQAMAEPPFGHRSETIKPLVASIRQNLLRLVNADESTHSAIVADGCGSRALQMTARNWSSAPKDEPKVLVASIGYFGDLWAEIYRSNGCKVEVMRRDDGDVIDKNALAEKLNSGYPYKIVALTHNETSTGTTNPLAEIAPIVKESGAMLFVDGVSSVGGIDIDVNEWGIDFLAMAPQKALGVPPGLTLAVVSNQALENVSNTNRGYDTDIMRHLEAHEKNFILTTPPEAQLGALAVQLNYMLNKETVNLRLARHRVLAAYIRQWAEIEGFNLLPAAENSSKTVSCFINSKGVDLEALKQRLRDNRPVQYGFDPGYAKLNKTRKAARLPNTFRVAHMGDRQPEELFKYLETLSFYMR